MISLSAKIGDKPSAIVYLQNCSINSSCICQAKTMCRNYAATILVHKKMGCFNTSVTSIHECRFYAVISENIPRHVGRNWRAFSQWSTFPSALPYSQNRQNKSLASRTVLIGHSLHCKIFLEWIFLLIYLQPHISTEHPWANLHKVSPMGLFPDTQNYGLRMRRECFPRHRGLAMPACIMARAWRTCRDACRDR